MRFATKWCTLVVLLLFAAVPAVRAQQTATVTGTVSDADSGEPLAGATVVLARPGSNATISATAAGVDGSFTLQGIAPGQYVLTVSLVGYTDARRNLTLTAGETERVDVALSASVVGLDAVIVSASRQPEKVLDAPASVSILEAEEIQQQSSGISSDAILRNTAGVDFAQTGVDRREMVLRGFNNAFSGATYVMTDYRQAAVPSLGVNMYSVMPISSLDLERVEVVRGPGSALYGAGVDAGVVHFMTKDPFSHPGTSFSIAGGERSTFAGDLRQAGLISEKLGYKITASYARAEDWKLDPSDPLDQVQLDADADDVTRNYDYRKFNGNLLLQYRFSPRVSLTATGGYSSLDATVLSGIGTLQADGFGSTYGQLRLQAGNFFAQTYVNRNDVGDSFVYGTGDNVVDNSIQYVTQAQYDLSTWGGRQRFTVGGDIDITNPKTDGTILGRNEDEVIRQYGAYLQSTTQLSPQFDLTLAARADYDNVIEEVNFSPRAALVYKITPEHSLRATFNRAFATPGTNSLFLDIVAGQLPGSTPIKLRGRGSAQGFTFERNATYSAIAGTDLVASSLNPHPDILGTDTPVGLPLADTYKSVYSALAAIDNGDLALLLSQQLQQNVTAEQVAIMKQLLHPDATQVEGFSKGQLMLLNPTTREVEPISDLVDVKPLKPTTSQTFELGYKGLVANRLLVAVDVYYTEKENFVGPLAVETPFVYVPTLAQDFSAAVTAGIQGNQLFAGALAQMGLSPEQVAAIITGMAQQNASFPDKPGTENDLPVAIVQPVENNPGPGTLPELLLSYRNFGRIQYYGADIAAHFAATDRLDFFGNVSWVSDDFFDNEELEEEGADLAVALNAPALKVKGGFAYSIPRGLSFNASGRYTEGYPVRSGPYVGDVESYFLLDLGAGYDFDRYVPGLRFDITVQNVLNNEHREFIGAPQIGRLALARLTYSL